MKPIQGVASFILLAWFTSTPVFAADVADKEALALAKKVYERADGSDRISFGSMQLIDKKGNKRKRSMFSYSKDKSYDQVFSLIRFTSPKDINGTGLLTKDPKNANDDTQQWVYLPALKRVRLISSGRKGGRFVGSDIFYEDLQNRLYTKDKHKIIGKEQVGKLKAIKLESIPKDQEDSAYSKKISWIHESSLIALKVKYYQDGEAGAMKELVVNKIKKIQGYWTVLKSTVTDADTKHKTIMEITKIKYDQGVKDKLFTKKVLENPKAEAEYRKLLN